MAQQGQPSTILTFDSSELGKVSGLGGLVGSFISGYEYNIVKNSIITDRPIYGIIIDKCRMMVNLPQQISNSNGETSITYTLDVFVCLKITDSTSFIQYFANPTIEPPIEITPSQHTIVYVPSNYIEKVYALPGIE